jgi:hypothetical protein
MVTEAFLFGISALPQADLESISEFFKKNLVFPKKIEAKFILIKFNFAFKILALYLQNLKLMSDFKKSEYSDI